MVFTIDYEKWMISLPDRNEARDHLGRQIAVALLIASRRREKAGRVAENPGETTRIVTASSAGECGAERLLAGTRYLKHPHETRVGPTYRTKVGPTQKTINDDYG